MENYQDIIAYIIVGIALVIVQWKIIRFFKKKKTDDCDSAGHHCSGCSQQDCSIKDLHTNISKKDVPLKQKNKK